MFPAKAPKCSKTEMIVVVVRNENQVDPRESIKRDSGLSQARCDETDGSIVGGICQDVHAVDLDENSGVIDEGDA
jgi:hypothetical protein